VKVVCAWCRSEGREGLIGERPPHDDPRETSGVCWMHKLETLQRTRTSVADREAPVRDGQVRFLVIVARHAVDLFARVSDQFLDDPRVQVLMDRRRGERRRVAAPHHPESRSQDRRRALDYWEDIRRHPVVIVPTWKARESRPPVRAPQPSPAYEVKTMESTDTVTQAWHQIEAWVRDSQHMVSQVIPSLMQECDELRKRADSAEAHVTRLKREVEDLQGEITRLGGEVDRLTDERAVITGVVERGMSEIARVAGEVLTALKER